MAKSEDEFEGNDPEVRSEGEEGGGEEEVVGAVSSEASDEEEAEQETPRSWRLVGHYFTEVRRALESPQAVAEQTRVLAGLSRSVPAIREYPDVQSLFAAVSCGSADYPRKDAAFAAIIAAHQFERSTGTFAFVVRALLPRLMQIAKERSRGKRPQEIEELCGRVMSAAAEVVLVYSLEKSRMVDVTLYWRIRDRMAADLARVMAEADATQSVRDAMAWVAPEVDRCAEHGGPLPFDTLYADQEAPAPFSDAERADYDLFLRSLPLSEPLSEIDRKLLVVDGCDESNSRVARELGLKPSYTKVRRFRLLRRIEKELRRAGFESVAAYLAQRKRETE